MFGTFTCRELIRFSEALLCSSPLVSHAVIFGAGRFLNGTILTPARPLVPYNEETANAFLDEIWPHVVSNVNSVVPRHSRLVRPLVLVASPDKPFLFSDKGTIKGRASLAQYDEVIDAAYRFVESGDDGTEYGTPLPFDPFNGASVEAYVRKLVSDVLGHAVEPNKDLFTAGLDSLLATRLRMEMNACFKKARIVRTLPRNAVYAHPTIISLARYLQSSASSVSVPESNGNPVNKRTPNEQALNEHVSNGQVEGLIAESLETRRSLIEQAITSFTSNFPEHRAQRTCATPNIRSGDVYAVSGTTGSLGATFVSVLLQQPRVDKIYLMNRRNLDGISMAQRHKSSFQDKGLDASKLEEAVSTGRVVYLEVELGEPKLGLPDATYEQVRTPCVRSHFRH